MRGVQGGLRRVCCSYLHPGMDLSLQGCGEESEAEDRDADE